ncbi:polyprenyl synthetase family protein [Desulfococcaceae bacterium HSG8]|nr:polyprenyl synthetase family protein [Desulfococcaceae bacterium HSG8]
MFNLTSYLQIKNKQINAMLGQILEKTPSRVAEAMKYSLMAGGKRIRPVLCIASAETVGGKAEDVLSLACAIEMIHTYSLIHDDLPAMDDDNLRRGKPTCHVAYDEATAVLAGDALLTLAFEVLSSIRTERHLPDIIRIVAQAAGYKGMIEGQMRDIASEGILLEPDELKEIHALKTGAMIEASVVSGAALGGGTPAQIEDLRIYARNIGLAFQVTDDILNIEGDPEILGKAVGTDENREKNTYPSILGMEKSKSFANDLINNALKVIDSFDSKSGPLRAIAAYIIERKK